MEKKLFEKDSTDNKASNSRKPTDQSKSTNEAFDAPSNKSNSSQNIVER